MTELLKNTDAPSSSKPQMIWVNIIFFLTITLVALIGTPIYLWKYSWPPAMTVWLTLFYLVATGMSITAGYHRLFAHVTYKAHPILEFFYLFFGAAAFEQSVLEWSAQHRDHHLYVDTDQDPYSIKKGFFYAHMGWILFWKHEVPFGHAKDLQKNPMVMHQYKHYHFWCIGSGIILPTLLGALYGDALGAFIFVVCLRLVIVHHATFCINSVCHMFGRATYDPEATARDHWLVALITNGEGYHNFHHRFAADYRNGVRWYHWDPSKWLILFLSFLGLTKDLKTTSQFRIIEAKLKADAWRVRNWLDKQPEPLRFKKLAAELETHFTMLCQHLSDWEASARTHRRIVADEAQKKSAEICVQAKAQLKEASDRFYSTLNQWKSMMGSQPGLASVI